LKIVPSADLGDLGPQQGASVAYNWKWYFGILTLALWLVLIAAFVLIKANRNLQALFILVPLLVVNVLWLMFKKAMGFSSADDETLSIMFHSLTVGITVLWLLAPKIGNRNRLVTFVLAFAVMALLGLVGAISHAGLEFTRDTVMTAIFLAVFAVALLVPFVLAGWCCRRRYSGVVFMLWLLVWTVVMGVVVMFSYVGIVVIISIMFGYPTPASVILMLRVVVMGVILGLCLCVINVPYMLLVLCTPFFRERFYACLRLKNNNIEKGPDNM